ncbi:Uu.00g084400.m01.CDS01 [Anthostomella pinea]|uniref:Uu.00g084400.m01.CDS01 n=1 Tax=Anthostomella pinea TaxID=933095 RepID=A0AAI8VLR5_9PEZI|nr:Uu.00g084400.m01.CDS01 [Anthostomella pinea]
MAQFSAREEDPVDRLTRYLTDLSLLHDSPFASETFTFIVGHEAKKFFLHPVDFAYLGPHFQSLANSGGNETSGNLAVWNKTVTMVDTEFETFQRLCQFMYTGRYDQVKPEPIDPKGSEKNRQYIANFLSSWDKKIPPMTESAVPYTGALNYLSTLLCQAKTYVLGLRYDIQDLRHFSLIRMYQTLRVLP